MLGIPASPSSTEPGVVDTAFMFLSPCLIAIDLYSGKRKNYPFFFDTYVMKFLSLTLKYTLRPFV